jgi:hypothetical protein
MALVVHDASALDFLEALNDSGAGRSVRLRRQFGWLARQVAEGVSVTIRTGDGELCMIAGLFPEAGEAEAWFAAGPALKANLKGAFRLWRELFEAVGQEVAPLTVRVYLAPDSVAGVRFAAWFGFQAEGVRVTPIGPVETWTRRFHEHGHASDRGPAQGQSAGG